ncbi:MAG: YIP1 family protein [Rudaea sp.]
MADYWHLFVGALFLKREAFEYQRDRKDSFAYGLFFIVLIGAAVGLAGLVGGALRFGTSPGVDAVKNVVLNHLQAMPFYSQSIQASPSAERQFLDGYNLMWQNLGSTFMGYPVDTAGWALLLASVVTTPLVWLVAWLIYGWLAHLIARRGALHIGLNQALGTLALATAPQALAVVGLLPQAGASPLVLSVWTMILNVFALRTAYRITTPRAIWAALFPVLLLLILLILLACIGIAILPAAVRGGR